MSASSSEPGAMAIEPEKAVPNGHEPADGVAPPTANDDTSLAELSTEEITAELERREQELKRLRAKRYTMRIQMLQLDKVIRQLEGDPAGATAGSFAPRGSGTPISDLPLAKAIARVFAIGDTFSPRETVARLTGAGYKTTVKTFGSMVTAVLSRERRFKRIGRGQYKRIA